MAPIKLKSAYPLFIFIARLVLAAVFLSAALPKIQAPEEFSIAIMNYRVTGPVLSAWVALFLPWVELIAGIGLILYPLRRASGITLATLLVLFIVMHIQAWARGLEIDCGCFGSETANLSAVTNYLWLVIRNSLLLVGCSMILHKDLRNQNKFPIAS
jgi:uncharacterized membrane protein YphA (DoxX/SURF4 family)